MDASELKMRIMKEIDTLESSKLEKVYGYVQNIIHGDKDLKEWEILSTAQKKGIREAITELDEGGGAVHEKVISKYRKKHSDA